MDKVDLYIKQKWASLSIEEKLALLSDSEKEYLRKQFSPAQDTNSPQYDILSLTNREREIFTILLTDKSPKEIAYALKVSYYTVDFHRKNLYRKLGIKSRTELFARYSACF